jgi:hypothetical protein
MWATIRCAWLGLRVGGPSDEMRGRVVALTARCGQVTCPVAQRTGSRPAGSMTRLGREARRKMPRESAE